MGAFTLTEMRDKARASGNDTFSLPSYRDILIIKFREIDRGMVFFFPGGNAYCRSIERDLRRENFELRRANRFPNKMLEHCGIRV